LYTQYVPGHEIKEIQKDLPDLSDRLAAELRRTMKELQVQATLAFLQAEERFWQKNQLTSNQVTNWTLTDQLRRISLPVGVNYGAAPRKVMELIEAAAGSHPRVMKDPPPRALFVGFGDSAIDFELRVWTDQFADWSKIRSEVAVAVHDAVQVAGMSFPFPQREVRLHYVKEKGEEL
jgi:potassium efflux system protein